MICDSLHGLPMRLMKGTFARLTVSVDALSTARPTGVSAPSSAVIELWLGRAGIAPDACAASGVAGGS